MTSIGSVFDHRPFFPPCRSLFTMSSTHFFHPLTELFRFGLFAQQVVPTRKGGITNSKYLSFSEWTSPNCAPEVQMFNKIYHGNSPSGCSELKSHAPLLMRLNSGEATFDPAASMLSGGILILNCTLMVTIILSSPASYFYASRTRP